LSESCWIGSNSASSEVKASIAVRWIEEYKDRGGDENRAEDKERVGEEKEREKEGKMLQRLANGQTCFDTSQARVGARHVQGKRGCRDTLLAHVNADQVLCSFRSSFVFLSSFSSILHPLHALATSLGA
jgi:hypothetical protein